jgi:hypothetical protein
VIEQPLPASRSRERLEQRAVQLGLVTGATVLPSGPIPLQRHQAGHGLMLHRSNASHPMAGANASAMKIA